MTVFRALAIHGTVKETLATAEEHGIAMAWYVYTVSLKIIPTYTVPKFVGYWPYIRVPICA